MKIPWFNNEESECKPYEHGFERGDHIVRWTSILLYPVQVHGIVLHSGPGMVKVLDFGYSTTKKVKDKDYNALDQKGEAIFDDLSQKVEDRGLRRFKLLTLTDKSSLRQWNKIDYSDWISWNKKKTELNQDDQDGEEINEAGIDSADLVIERTFYLISNPSALPPYHIFFSNSECIAVWCKTGTWSTLQASIFLAILSSKNVATCASVKGFLATTSSASAVHVGGASGLFGTTFASVLAMVSVQPLFIPILAGFGAVTVGMPIAFLMKSNHVWKVTSENLREGFSDWKCNRERYPTHIDNEQENFSDSVYATFDRTFDNN